MKTVFIVNPVSGRGAGARALPLLGDVGPVWISEHAGHAVELGRLAAEGFDRVIAVGGDGTLGQVVRGVHGSGVEVGLIPVGTGNDFARHTGISLNPGEALTLAREGSARFIDLGLLRGEPFINVVACGFDAEVGHRVNRGYRWASGTAAYALALFQSLSSFRPVPVSLVLDGRSIEAEAALLAVANASSYGGGMRIAPAADIEDGELDLVMIGRVGRVELLQQFPKIFSGKHVDHPKVSTFKFKRLEVRAERSLPMLLDGDETGATPFHAEVLPGALRMVLPLSSTSTCP